MWKIWWRYQQQKTRTYQILVEHKLKHINEWENDNLLPGTYVKDKWCEESIEMTNILKKWCEKGTIMAIRG